MHSAISIFGPDRTGIIAQATEALSSHNINIEDASMTLLYGHFAMILVVDAAEITAEELESSIRSATELNDLTISFSHDIDPPTFSGEPVSRYVFHLTVHDSPGIVARVSGILSDFGANVVDCATRKSTNSDLFTMILDVDVVESTEDAVVEALDRLAGEFSGDVMFHRIEDIDL